MPLPIAVLTAAAAAAVLVVVVVGGVAVFFHVFLRRFVACTDSNLNIENTYKYECVRDINGLHDCKSMCTCVVGNQKNRKRRSNYTQKRDPYERAHSVPCQ